ncbi:MAG: hypothetical protein CMO26_13775 [Thiotrichales bacterium]|nr:hypothetical protein [Thiotrichales bacterium]
MLKGNLEPADVFEPLLPDDVGSPGINEYLVCYSLLARKSTDAPAVFTELADRVPDDCPVSYHAERFAICETGTTIIMAGK